MNHAAANHPLVFPFTAIVGLDRAKLSMVLHAVDPRIGGILLAGPRGAAKSTLARAFGSLLNQLDQTPRPWIEVPLGASAERLTGGTEIRSLVESGLWKEQAGLIESAHNGALYVDEINLLPDHLADLLLDPASCGFQRTERDGTSRAADARFILIGSMNPEEGELRPQLSDRFAHGIKTLPPSDVSDRAEATKRRLAFDDDPRSFISLWAPHEAELVGKINAARANLPTVSIPDSIHAKNSEIAATLGMESLRAGIAALRSARAIAALAGSLAVNTEHLEDAWTLCAPHRDVPPPTAPPAPPPHHPQPPSQRTAPAARPATPPLPPIPQPPPLPTSHKCRKLSHPTGEAQAAQPHASNPTPAIAWLTSVLHSLAHAWRPGSPGIRLKTLSTPRPIEPQVLLDASRSTASKGFLATCIDDLSKRLTTHAIKRSTLHLLTGGDVKSFLRVPRKNLISLLESLAFAQGGSAISNGLTRLRVRATRQPFIRTVVWVYSDGIASPNGNETPVKAMEQMLKATYRIRQAGLPLLWLAPNGTPGTQPHLSRLRTIPGIQISTVATGTP
jgi:magnesium chelatase subunit I